SSSSRLKFTNSLVRLVKLSSFSTRNSTREFNTIFFSNSNSTPFEFTNNSVQLVCDAVSCPQHHPLHHLQTPIRVVRFVNLRQWWRCNSSPSRLWEGCCCSSFLTRLLMGLLLSPSAAVLTCASVHGCSSTLVVLRFGFAFNA
ncbi:hypothetical protein A2U01_0015724, partial [Trifolium medium]|nr:hypothetical protein [Trifolium medium]